MKLREKMEKFRASAAFTESKGWPITGGQPTVAEFDQLLEALDLAEAVKWIEGNDDVDAARVHLGPNWERGWCVWDIRYGRDAGAATLPEAVAALKAALKAWDARGGEE